MRVNDMGDAADTMASFLYYVRYLLITRVHTAIHLYWTDWSYRRELILLRWRWNAKRTLFLFKKCKWIRGTSRQVNHVNAGVSSILYNKILYKI
jgi:hypothetical protein